MPNLMAALPNIGGALCSTQHRSSDDGKTQKPLKFAGVPQSNEMISAASWPKFTILWGRVKEILPLNKFFSDC